MSFSEIMKIEISDQRTVALKYNPQAITVTEIPKTNIGIIRYNNRVMVWQNLIEQYCYLSGF